MSANQARFRIATMARVLGVSPSGYHAWRRRGASVRAQADADLAVRVSAIHARSRGTYGAPRIHAELSAGGAAVSRKRVARVMRAAGIAGVSRRRGPRTTRRAVRVRPAPDRVARRFEAAGPNRLWVADVTYVPTRAGFLYPAVVLDVFSRRVAPTPPCPPARPIRTPPSPPPNPPSPYYPYLPPTTCRPQNETARRARPDRPGGAPRRESPPPPAGYFASGSGRSWKCATLLGVPLPVSV